MTRNASHPRDSEVVTQFFEIMKKEGRTMTELSQLSDRGITHDTISNWKRRNTSPSVEKLEDVLKIMGYKIKIVKEGRTAA